MKACPLHVLQLSPCLYYLSISLRRIRFLLYLCEQIRQFYPMRQFLVFLDNLFLNINFAHCLYAIGFSVMGTTRKNAASLPESLIDILAKDKKAKKEAKEEAKPKKLQIVYNSVMAVIVERCLAFLWQDNNTVVAITTAHSLHRPEDRVQRVRKRPSGTSSQCKEGICLFRRTEQEGARYPCCDR